MGRDSTREVEQLREDLRNVRATLRHFAARQEIQEEIDHRFEGLQKRARREIREQISTVERARRSRRFWQALLWLTAIWAAIQIHDVHIERCVAAGPNTEAEQAVCNALFPTHDHPLRNSQEQPRLPTEWLSPPGDNPVD